MAGAEQAAAEVLEEARALSGGLRQLGRSLEEQADRILRDVQAAHRRMQADLRCSGPATSGAGVLAPGPRRPADRARRRPDAPAREARRGPRGERPNPFEDLEVPSWVAASS